jgi:hypothetical protein
MHSFYFIFIFRFTSSKLHYVHGAWAFLLLFMHSLLYSVFDYHVCINHWSLNLVMLLFYLNCSCRYLQHLGYEVTYVRNFTDIDENFNPAISTWLLLWLEIYSRTHRIIAFVHCTLLGINLLKICGISHSFGPGIFLDSCWNSRKMHSMAS